MLITLENLKAILKITGGTEDAWLTAVCEAVSAQVEAYCNRTFTKATYADEVASGSGTRYLPLKHFPIVGGVTLHQNYGEQGSPQWQAVNPSYYSVDTYAGMLYMPSGFFGDGVAYKATYDAGYDPIPAEVQYAVAKMVGEERATSGQATGIKSETLGEYRYDKFDNQATGGDSMTRLGLTGILDRYRLPAV